MAESSAIHLIKKAVQFDSEHKYTDALVCYKEGIELLLNSLKTIQDERKKVAFREKICNYIDRAEALKKIVNEIEESGKYHEQIQIDDNSIGNSYEKLLNRFFDDDTLIYIKITDPYIRSKHQLHNFLKFCEMVVKLSKNVKKITLYTGQDDNTSLQEQKLAEIKSSLSRRSIDLDYRFEQNLHDREIKLSNGWIIKIGRGLDYFKPPEVRDAFCIGFHDFDLRACNATTIDIFHEKMTKTSNTST